MIIFRRAALGLYVKYLFYVYDLPKWKYNFKRLYSTGGYTDYNNHTITFSILAVDRLNLTDLRQLAIHEVANELTPEYLSHSGKWKKKMIEMGGSVEICTPCFTKDSDYRWNLNCETCGNNRKMQIKYHIWCPNCGATANYELNS